MSGVQTCHAVSCFDGVHLKQVICSTFFLVMSKSKPSGRELARRESEKREHNLPAVHPFGLKRRTAFMRTGCVQCGMGWEDHQAGLKSVQIAFRCFTPRG